MNIYTFHRVGGFYPLELADNATARQNAIANPGTIKVVNEATGAKVFDGFHPAHGMAYVCLKAYGQAGEVKTKKGKVCVFDRPEDQLHSYSSRYHNILLNGYNALRQPGVFEPWPHCPVCGVAMCDDKGAQAHNALDCEEERRVKAVANGQ